MFRRTALPLLTVLLLCGCAGATNVKSVKAPDYTKVPRNLITVLPANSPLDDRFRSSLTASLGACGTMVQFISAPDLAAAKASHADAMLTITPLGQETTTSYSRYGADTWLSKARFEFALIDVETGKNVWKEQIDFTGTSTLFRLFQQPQPITWAEALFDKMKLDGLTACAAGIPPVVPPTPVVAAAPLPGPTPKPEAPTSEPAPISPSATLSALSTPVSVVAATPLSPSPPSTPGDAFTVNGVTYSTSDEALRALRQAADRNLAQTSAVGPPIAAALLVVVPDPESGAPAATRQSNERRVYAMTQREIQNQAYVRALRRLGPFKSVMTARPSEIHVGDFRGAAFKLWRDETAGVWVLTSTKGGEQRFEVVPGDDGNDLPSMLEKVQAAADSLFR